MPVGSDAQAARRVVFWCLAALPLLLSLWPVCLNWWCLHLVRRGDERVPSMIFIAGPLLAFVGATVAPAHGAFAFFLGIVMVDPASYSLARGILAGPSEIGFRPLVLAGLFVVGVTILAGYWRAAEGASWNIGVFLLAGGLVVLFLPLFSWVYARVWLKSFLAVAAAVVLLLFAYGFGRRLGADAFRRQVVERLDDYEKAVVSLQSSTSSPPTVTDPHPDLAWASLQRNSATGDMLTFALRADSRNLRIQRWRRPDARTPSDCARVIRPGWCWLRGPEGK